MNTPKIILENYEYILSTKTYQLIDTLRIFTLPSVKRWDGSLIHEWARINGLYLGNSSGWNLTSFNMQQGTLWLYCSTYFRNGGSLKLCRNEYIIKQTFARTNQEPTWWTCGVEKLDRLVGEVY